MANIIITMKIEFDNKKNRITKKKRQKRVYFS